MKHHTNIVTAYLCATLGLSGCAATSTTAELTPAQRIAQNAIIVGPGNAQGTG